MKKLMLSFVLVLTVFAAGATHFRSGYISYDWYGARTYSITLTVISDPRQPADANSDSAFIHFGDGSSATIRRTSVESISAYAKKNVYTITHQYPAEGTYTISYEAPNLISNISNINGGNSLNVPFRVESVVYVGTKASSHRPAGFNQDIRAGKGIALYTTTNCYNYDGDSISYELIKLENLQHTYPADLTVHPMSGMLSWNNPFNAGAYYVLIKVDGYTEGRQTSTITIAQTIEIFNVPAGILPSAFTAPGFSITNQGWYRVIKSGATDTPLFSFNYTKPHPALKTTFFGEGEVLSANLSSGTTENYSLRFPFLPHMKQRNWPYFYTVRIMDTSVGLSRDYSVGVYHGAAINLKTKEFSSKQALVYPNPFKQVCTFAIGDEKAQQLHVYDCNGREVYSQKVSGHEFIFDASALSKGTYQYLIETLSGALVTGKLILAE